MVATMITITKHYVLPLLIGGVLIVVGFIIGNGNRVNEQQNTADPARSYSLINPSVLINSDKHFIINFAPLRDKVRQITDAYNHKTYFYFVYLNNASWIGVNERETFSAASLAKVPLAIALYKAVEEGKLSLNQAYTIEEIDLNSGFGDLYKTGTDKSFTIEELIKIMLEQSDNTALSALIGIFHKIGIDNPYDEVYQAFGWVLDIDKNVNANEINLKTISNMYLSLYNANYISAEHSQKILEYLSESPFNDKIAAGVPYGIPVSHKIGVSGETLTYSDCGIVYAPNRNYLLCLGSEGASEDDARKFMKEVSETVYDFVINN